MDCECSAVKCGICTNCGETIEGYNEVKKTSVPSYTPDEDEE